MNNQVQAETTNHMSTDEISITDIVKKLWQRRGVLVVVPLLFLLLGAIVVFGIAAKTESPTVLFVHLQGIDKSTYPNGATFSPQDLLIPEVLERAAASLHLAVDDDLRKALQVDYGAPTTIGIQKIYQIRLANKKLSATDIAALNRAYQDELQQVSTSGLKITVNHAMLGISPAQGAVLANAIPRAWTEVFTRKYRVIIDSALDNVSILGKDNPLLTTADILSARGALRRMDAGLKFLTADNRLKAIVSDGGFNSSDLQSRLQDFNILYFRTIFSGSFDNPDAVAKTFKVEIGYKIDELDRNIEELDRSLADLKSFRIRTPQSGVKNGGGEMVQFGDDALKQVVELANQASLSDYMRDVLTARRKLIAKKASLQTELSRSAGKSVVANDKVFYQNAEREFLEISQEYASLLKTARIIRRQAYGDFYQPLGSPGVVGSLLPAKSLLILVLSVLLGGMFSVLLVLVWPNSVSAKASTPETTA